MTQTTLNRFFAQDTSPLGVACLERARKMAEEMARINKKEAERAEQRELESIAAEQDLIAETRRKRDIAQHSQREEAHRKRMADLTRRRFGAASVVRGLWLGTEASASNIELFTDEHITAVINVTRDIPCTFEEEEEGEGVGETAEEERPRPDYLRVAISDSENDSIAEHLDGCVKFIERAIGSGGNVLVHCKEGRSRSAAVVAAFLMQSRKLKLVEAVAVIAESAWTPSINAKFMSQLGAFEVRLFPELAGHSTALPSKDARESRPDVVELHPGMTADQVAKLKPPPPRKPRKKLVVDAVVAPDAPITMQPQTTDAPKPVPIIVADGDHADVDPPPPKRQCPAAPVITGTQKKKKSAIQLPGKPTLLDKWLNQAL